MVQFRRYTHFSAAWHVHDTQDSQGAAKPQRAKSTLISGVTIPHGEIFLSRPQGILQLRSVVGLDSQRISKPHGLFVLILLNFPFSLWQLKT